MQVKNATQSVNKINNLPVGTNDLTLVAWLCVLSSSINETSKTQTNLFVSKIYWCEFLSFVNRRRGSVMCGLKGSTIKKYQLRKLKLGRCKLAKLYILNRISYDWLSLAVLLPVEYAIAEIYSILRCDVDFM